MNYNSVKYKDFIITNTCTYKIFDNHVILTNRLQMDHQNNEVHLRNSLAWIYLQRNISGSSVQEENAILAFERGF